VQLTKREFLTTHPGHPGSEAAPAIAVPRYPGRRGPRNTFEALVILTRAEATFALVMPVMVGAVLGWWQTGQYSLLNLALALLGMAANGWGLAALWEYHDYRFSRRPGARQSVDPVATAYALMGHGVVAPQTVRDVGRILLVIGALCSLILAMFAGWPILFFSGLSFLVVWTVIYLPLHYGYRGWGLTEGAIWLGMGVLPLLTGYYGQSGEIALLPVWAAGAFGLFSMLLFFNYNAIHYRRDWLIHKRTLTVNLGLGRALDFTTLVTVAAYVLILLLVTLSHLPLWALTALGALPVALAVFSHVDHDNVTPETCWWVYRTSVHAGWLTGVLFSLGLALDRLV
jgi:1,4-dihydroxy-2-naphthoate octaprenyltransferase